MLYKNGREIKLGDAVIGTGNHIKGLIVGHIVGIVPAHKSSGAGDPPTKDVCKILTHIKSPDHKSADTATFNTVQEFGEPQNFVHAGDAYAMATDIPAMPTAKTTT